MRLIHLAVAAAMTLALASTATASPVLVLNRGHVSHENDPFLAPVSALPSAPAGARAAAHPRARVSQAAVRTTLAALLSSGQISQRAYDARIADYNDALGIRHALAGTRRHELSVVIDQLNAFAATGQLIPSRLNVLWLQLRRNAEWWSHGTLLGANERVRFKGSRVIFQYFPGQGLQFHPLANWGRAEALINHGYYPNVRAFMKELIPLAAKRGSSIAWEYYFYFGGGAPPWTSGLSQGTALITLARAYRQFNSAHYLGVARRALSLYQLSPPTGVRVKTRRGAYYVEYSFYRRYRVINGFIQALIGLYDFAQATNDPTARALFRAGDREARHELPSYDTGRWSRYDNTGVLSRLNYHVLLRDFLRQICARTHTRIYCSKAARFTRDLRRGPPKGVG